MVLLLIIPPSWQGGGFCLKYLKVNAAGIKILPVIESRHRSLPFVNRACLCNWGNKSVLKEICEHEVFLFPNVFHRLFILFKYTVI